MCLTNFSIFINFVNPSSANPTKWSNTQNGQIADVILAIQLKKNREHYSGDCIPVARS